MTAVAILPRKVRDKEKRVKDEANCVIEPLIVTEGMVTTLMCNDPDTSHDTALNSPVNWPSHVRKKGRKLVEVIGSNIVQDRNYDQVINKVGERVEYRALETVRGDGFFELTECKWWFGKWNSLQGVKI